MIVKKVYFASVSYKTDMTKEHSEDIIIALVMNFIFAKPKGSIYILSGKQSLSESEKEKVGFMGRKLLKNPVRYVEKFTDEAFARHENFFKYLSKKLLWSIRLSKIEEVQIPIDMRSIFINLFNDINKNKEAAISRYFLEIHSRNETKINLDGIDEFNRVLSGLQMKEFNVIPKESKNNVKLYDLAK